MLERAFSHPSRCSTSTSVTSLLRQSSILVRSKAVIYGHSMKFRSGRASLVGAVVIFGAILGACGASSAGKPKATTDVNPTGISIASGSLLTMVAPNGGRFEAIDCASAGNCTAVGHDGESPGSVANPIYAVETQGRWNSVIELAGPGGSGGLSGVSCPLADGCAVVGFSNSGAWADRESNGNWASPQIQQSLLTGGFNAVDCPTEKGCTAVGISSSVDGTQVTAKFVQGAWEDPLVSSEVGQFSGVSCWSTFHCAVVGSSASGASGEFDASDGTSRPLDLSGPSRGVLTSVKCIVQGHCVAVGYDYDSGVPLYVQQNGDTWTESTTNSSTRGGLDGLSCVSAQQCIAVGSDNNQSGKVSAVAVRMTNGKWGPVVKLPLRGIEILTAVSCKSASRCTAVGYTSGGQGTPQQPVVVSLSLP